MKKPIIDSEDTKIPKAFTLEEAEKKGAELSQKDTGKALESESEPASKTNMIASSLDHDDDDESMGFGGIDADDFERVIGCGG